MRNAISDHYTLVINREIAVGGMGTVYEATQLGVHGFEKTVAVKTLLPSISRNTRFVDMFIAEGKLVADLVHENIVQIYQLGCQGDEYYIVMEYVHGLSLHDFIRHHSAGRKRVPVELAVFIVSRIARGLAYAHTRQDAARQPLNIVHRDVCPTNILITTEGLPKLADFGIAKAANQAVPNYERSLMGKLFYMSPEQAQRTPVDHRSDIYSLGLVFFETLAMQRARDKWRDQILDAACAGHVDWECLPADLDPNLTGILQRMLTAGRDERYENVGRLAYDLEYHIYHGGYGPTVVTLENYLRAEFPGLYAATSAGQPVDPSETTVAVDDSAT